MYNAVHTSSFSVDQSVEMDCTILSCFGLKDFISKEAMYEYVCENLHLGVVSGNGKYSTLRIFTPTSFNDIQHGIFA